MASKQKTNQTVRMATIDQLKQVWSLVMQALPTRLTWAQAQYWIGHGTELISKIRAIFAEVDSFRSLLDPWVQFYRTEFNIELDPSAVSIPDRKEGFDWLIVVAPGITIEMVLAACAKRFKVWRWTNDNLDQLTENARSAINGPYAIWIRPRNEADEELKNKSYNDLQKAGIPGTTLLEYLLKHLEYFIATGQHLDSINITLCTGSPYRGGRVAGADWGTDGGTLDVGWYGRGSAGDGLRSRQAVV